jgi:hypothetical protein
MKSASAFVLVFSLVAALSNAAQAERRVVVNGVRLSVPEIMELERIHCGPIPNGHYWLDLQTGIWGYAGDPQPQGYVTDNCYNPGRRPSLSERGMLFSPYDFVR